MGVCGLVLHKLFISKLLPFLFYIYLASAISGQMSVIRTVSVPPPTLPDTCVSQAVQRQSHSEYVKKWKPFGYSKSFFVINK